MQMIAQNDEDGDGELNFSEFVHLLAGACHIHAWSSCTSWLVRAALPLHSVVVVFTRGSIFISSTFIPMPHLGLLQGAGKSITSGVFSQISDLREAFAMCAIPVQTMQVVCM